MHTCRSRRKSLSILPVPSTTEASGSSAMETGKPGFFANALVEILEQRAAAGEHDAAVADVGGKFGRSALQSDADGVHDGGDAFGERFADFAVVDGDGARARLRSGCGP